MSKWRERHPDRKAALSAKSFAEKRAPGCVPEPFDFEGTIPFYAEARRRTRETGVPHQVDHIMPLSRGGKHSPENLQVLTSTENARKGDQWLSGSQS